MPVCNVTGCQLERVARGWCSVHYARWWRTGDPLAPRVEIHRTNLTPRRYV